LRGGHHQTPGAGGGAAEDPGVPHQVFQGKGKGLLGLQGRGLGEAVAVGEGQLHDPREQAVGGKACHHRLGRKSQGLEADGGPVRVHGASPDPFHGCSLPAAPHPDGHDAVGADLKAYSGFRHGDGTFDRRS